ncbi:hypothetical protein H8E88_18285 [candidate division KSB1 bacterium]|nr:hypothetical protein [candidate division KSB1 bacterium]
MPSKIQTVTILFLIISTLIMNCASVNYVGKTYPPSKNVDVYYSKDDIKKDHVIIGHAVGSGGFLVSDHEIKIELIREAKIRGADGILITGIQKSIDNPENNDERQIKAKLLKYK